MSGSSWMNIPGGGLGTPHQSIILHKMFLHAAERGQKEAEHMFCQGCWGSVYNPNSEADQSAMDLVGYHTSQNEIRDIYQSIHLLQRAPGLPSCRDWLRRKAIQDILFSLKGQLHRWGHSTAARDQELQEEQVRLNWWESYKEALRVAHQRVLDTTKALKSNTERLSWRRDRSHTHSWTHSQSRSHSRTRSRSRSHSRTQSQNCSQGSTRNAHTRYPDGPPSRRRVTFRNPEAEMSPRRDVGDYSTEPSVLDVEMWLEWQAWQLGTPTWWTELKAIPGIRDPQKLAQKIRASFYIPQVRMRTYRNQNILHPPRCLDRNVFLPDKLSYRDVWQQLALLMIAYARSLQYWVEKQSLPRSQNLCPLAESVVKLWEAVKEYVTFTHWDIVQDLGVTNLDSSMIFTMISYWHLAYLWIRFCN